MKTQRKKEWFDNESFWRNMYPFLFSDKRFADAEHEVEKAVELTKPKGKAILDLCCGPGRCSIELAKRGYTVTAVDTTKYLLDKAREKARAAKLKIEWVHKDMRDFVRPNTFHLVLSMFTSFGYFDNKEEDIAVLENILASLRPGATCLIDVMGKELLARIFQPTVSEILPDGTKLVQRHEICDGWTRARNEWILIDKGRAKSFKFYHTIYSGQELRDRMQQVGFSDVKLFGNLDGDEYGPNAQRLIVVGKKPGTLKTSRKRVTSACT